MPLLLMVVHDLERVVGHIDHHVSMAEVARQPAPALHVGDNALDLFARLGRRDDGGHLLRAFAPAGWSCGRLGDESTSLDRTGAQFGELLFERLEATVRRIEAFERGAGIGCFGDFSQDIGRRRRVIAVVDFRHHPARRDAAGGEMAGISEHRIAERDVGVGEFLRAGGDAECRDLIVARVEPVGGGVRQLRHHRFGARVELAVGGPQRRIIARGIEGLPSPRARACVRCACRIVRT